MRPSALASACALAGLAAVGRAAAEAPRATTPAAAPVLTPPELRISDVQFGAALVGDVLIAPGPVCPSGAVAPCILGSGGGLAIGVGRRTRATYIGGTYAFDKLDANNLLRLAVLQQLRAEGRWVLDTTTRYGPFVSAGLGAAIFGNEWGYETFGATGFVGAGLETQLSRKSLFRLGVAWRPLVLRGWTDAAGQRRETGLGSFFGFEIGLEQRSETAD